MMRVTLVGNGNVARQLFRAWQEKPGISVRAVLARNPERAREFAGEVPCLELGETPPECDLVLLAVRDDAIPEVASHFRESKALVAHCSGRTPLSALAGLERPGVFYPLQSFSGSRKVAFSKVPICLEAGRDEDLVLLRQLAEATGGQVREVNSAQRERLHLAAVFVNNFTNHLYTLAHDLLEREQLDFELLLPLIRETTQRLEDHPPGQLQTGPALRGDQATQEGHIKLLEDPLQREIYQQLSKAIQTYYGNKL